MVCEYRHQNQTFTAVELDDKLKSLPLSQLRMAVQGLGQSVMPAALATTGQPMQVFFSRNTQSAKANAPVGMDFGQDVEPAGEYMNLLEQDTSAQARDGWQYGSIAFINPLVLEHKDTTSQGWKRDLSEMFDGKTGQALSDAVRAAGYDAIVTRDSYGYSESVNLEGVKDGGAKPSKSRAAQVQAKASKRRNPQEDTQAFKDWFGDSKVVDADGKPLVVYHGTPNTFSSFDPSKAREDGFFFTADPEHAEIYAGARGAIMPLYLAIKNPMRVHGSQLPLKATKKLINRMIEDAKVAGHDGIHIEDFRDSIWGRSETYVAFSPEQIKSATGNNGNFDASNPDIRFSVSRLPRAIIGDTLGALANHADYAAAKSGDTAAAMRLAADVVTPDLLAKLQDVQADAVLGVMVDEEGGTNAIPTAAAAHMAKGLGLDVGEGVYKSAGAKRTTLLGLDRVFSRPTFEGQVPAGTRYILVDDTLTQGGTIAALAEHLHNQGAEVAAVVALTGKNYSSLLAPTDNTLAQVRAKLGDAEDQFQQATGRRFEDLTESEARYLANFKPQSAVRDRLDQTAGNSMAAPDGQGAGDQDAVSASLSITEGNVIANDSISQMRAEIDRIKQEIASTQAAIAQKQQALTQNKQAQPTAQEMHDAARKDYVQRKLQESVNAISSSMARKQGGTAADYLEQARARIEQGQIELFEREFDRSNPMRPAIKSSESASNPTPEPTPEENQKLSTLYRQLASAQQMLATEVLAEMERKQASQDDGYVTLYHGSNSDSLANDGGGQFGGLFTLSSHRSAEGYNGGIVYEMRVRRDKIAGKGASFDASERTIWRHLNKLTGGKRLNARQKEVLWEMVVDDISPNESQSTIHFENIKDTEDWLDKNMSGVLAWHEYEEGIAGFSWEAQRLRGQLAKALGYDAVVMRDENGTSTLVLDTVEAKKYNPEIRQSLPRRNGAAPWTAPSANAWDSMVYRMQDKQVDTKRVVDEIAKVNGAIQDDLDVYLNERLFHGRSAKRTQDFVNDELNPLAKEMAEAGLKIEDLDEYLHARHAKEANAVIAQRNPDMPDGGAGMTNAQVDAYFASLNTSERATLDAMAAKVDAMMKATRQLYVDYELESQDTVDGWGQMFQHYVPLMREDMESRPGIGQGYSVKGRETKGRTGSTRKVVDILANIAMQRERAIVRGEKNRVAQALVGLAYTNPNTEFWDVDSPKVEQVFNAKTGKVENRVDPMWKNRENAIVAKTREADGSVKEHAVVFNERNERALRMAESLKNLDAAQLEGLWGASAKITRYFSAINTQYNPVFGIVNFMRDVQGAAINLASTPLKGQQRKVLRNTLPALAGIWSDLRAQRHGQQGKGPWAALWDEFQMVGGQTGYRDLFRTSADRADAIRSTLDPHAWMDSKWGKVFTAGGALKVPMAVAQKHLGFLFDMLSDYNEAIENGIRLSAYKAGLETGLSQERAAALAKNLTVDFNKKGQVAQQAGALYAFFNAAMQGTARMGEVLVTMEPGKPKTMRLSSTGQKIVGGGMLLGAMQAMMMAAAGFDDENPPDFVRERALIIPTFGMAGTPEKGYISIPMPLGLHVIPNLGRHAVEFAMSGFEQPAQRAIKLVALLADAFNPIGNAGMSVQTLTPTALDPLVALTENKDFAGRPIAKESRNEAVPGHALGRDTSTMVGKAIAEGINWLSGGNEYVSGALSPTPDQIDYLVGQVFGGVGREYGKVEQTLSSAVTGEALSTHKIPLVGRLVGNADGQSSQASSFYANLERVNRVETEAKAMAEDGKRDQARELLRNAPERLLIAKANTAERQLNKLRQKKRELIKSKADATHVKRVEEEITQVMLRFNTAVNSLKDNQKA